MHKEYISASMLTREYDKLKPFNIKINYYNTISMTNQLAMQNM